MFERNIDLKNYADGILKTLSVVPAPDYGVVADVLSEMQHRLYAGVICRLQTAEVALQKMGDALGFTVANVIASSGDAKTEVGDIRGIIVGGEEIYCASPESFLSLSIPAYCILGDTVRLRNVTAQKATVVYLYRPASIRYSEASGFSGHLCVPDGYLPFFDYGVLAQLCSLVGDFERSNHYGECYNAFLRDLKDRFGEVKYG